MSVLYGVIIKFYNNLRMFLFVYECLTLQNVIIAIGLLISYELRIV